MSASGAQKWPFKQAEPCATDADRNKGTRGCRHLRQITADCQTALLREVNRIRALTQPRQRPAHRPAHGRLQHRPGNRARMRMCRWPSLVSSFPIRKHEQMSAPNATMPLTTIPSKPGRERVGTNPSGTRNKNRASSATRRFRTGICVISRVEDCPHKSCDGQCQQERSPDQVPPQCDRPPRRKMTGARR